MNRQDKRKLFVKKQQKQQKQIEKKQLEDLKDKRFILKQTGITRDKSNKKLEELHTMKKANYLFDLAIAKDVNDESIAIIGENLQKAIDSEKDNGKSIIASNANHSFVSLLEMQEKLIENVKAFGIDVKDFEAVEKLAKANDKKNEKFDDLRQKLLKGDYKNNKNQLLEDIQKLIGYVTEIDKSNEKNK